MRFCVLGSPTGWYFHDLARAALGRYELIGAPFSRVHCGWAADGRLEFASAGLDLAQFDAVLVRTMPPGSLEQVVLRMDILGCLEAQGVVVRNPPRALELAVDKYLSVARMRQAGLPTPATWVGQDAEEAVEAFGRLGGDVVVKPMFGSEGRGLMRVSDESLLWRVARLLTQQGAVLYLQEFIPHQGYDLRVLVVGPRMLAIRRVSDSDWRTNVSRGARAEPYELRSEVAELAGRAARLLGTPLAGVDILPDRDGRFHLLEVNAVPGWRGLARALDVDVASLMLDYLRDEVARGRVVPAAPLTYNAGSSASATCSARPIRPPASDAPPA